VNRALLVILAALSCACGTSPCGLQIVQHIQFPEVDPKTGRRAELLVECCGGSAYRDLNFTTGEYEVDLSGSTASSGRVDGFVTSGDCVKLFAGPYSGTATNPLCTVYLGPVAPGAVSQRKKLTPGRYRIFAQAFASNEQPTPFIFDMAIWSNKCGWNPTAP
jgi:hypothetical protein